MEVLGVQQEIRCWLSCIHGRFGVRFRCKVWVWGLDWRTEELGAGLDLGFKVPPGLG